MPVEPKEILTLGLVVVTTIKNKPYQGVITQKETDKGFLVRLARPDQTVMTIMLDSICPLQCITDDGLAYKFECRLLSKKIPHIGLSYPEEVPTGINIRKHTRIPVSFWAVILEPGSGSGGSELKEAGEGSIVDLSEGGCKFMTGNKYKVNNPIFLSFEYQEGKGPFSFRGKVKQIRPAPHELIYYGIQFDDTSPEFLKNIKAVLQNAHL